MSCAKRLMPSTDEGTREDSMVMMATPGQGHRRHPSTANPAEKSTMVNELPGSAVNSFAKTGGGLLPRALAALYIRSKRRKMASARPPDCGLERARPIALDAAQSLRASCLSITSRQATTSVNVPSQITSWSSNT